MKHCMLLWKKPCSDSLDFEIEALYHILTEFKNRGSCFAPNYLPAKNKKKSRSFEWSFKSFKEKILSAPINKGNKALGELGYSISLFSSFDENECVGFQATVGTRNDRFYDVLIVNLPDGLLYAKKNRQMICELFRIAVKEFRPFWGCITDLSFFHQFSDFVDQGKPTTVHWVNYWSNEIVSDVGEQCLSTIFSQYSITMKNGVFMTSCEPLDIAVAKNLEFIMGLNKKMRLE